METPFHSAYVKHKRVRTEPVGASRTKQSFLPETEINTIVAKYQATGLVDHINTHGEKYSLMPSPGDFTEAMNLVMESKTMFNELPSNLRSRFGNDPAQFLDFVGNEENRDEMISMGLVRPEIPDVVEPEPELDIPPADPEADPPAAP